MADHQPAHPEAVLGEGSAEMKKTDVSEEYSLFEQLIPQLDTHLIFPLLEDQFKDDPKLAEYQYAVLRNTNMVDYLSDLYKKIHSTNHIPAELTEKKAAVLRNLNSLQNQAEKISNLLADDEVLKNLRSDKVANMNYLKDTHNVQTEDIDALFKLGRFQADCGDYADAAELLNQFRILSTDSNLVTQSMWGRLMCEILTANWAGSVEEINRIKENIDTKLFNNPRAQLDHRNMLMHYMLFPMFNDESARETLTELMLTPNYINSMQTISPYLLRYLASSVIISRGAHKEQSNTTRFGGSVAFQKQWRDVQKSIKQERYRSRDPIILFVHDLYVQCYFDEATEWLRVAEELCRGDFFLCNSTDLFVDGARRLYTELYCKVCNPIPISDLSQRLGMSADEGEHWIVEMIRDTHLDAKIDHHEKDIIMNHPQTSVYQTVIERTKGGFFRTQALAAAVAAPARA